MHTRIVTQSQHQIEYQGRIKPAKVWTGGVGAPLVLLHGGWGGAAAHWDRVWHQLAQHYTIIAPELPGVVADGSSGAPLATYDAYAEWVEAVVRGLGYESACFVGNSLGASIAWQVAMEHGPICSSLVMVDGFPPPTIPAFVRFFIERVPGIRKLILNELKKVSYSSDCLKSAFFNAENAPRQVRATLLDVDQRQLEHMLTLLMNNRSRPAVPKQRTLIVWGAQDRLPKADTDVAISLHQRIEQSELQIIPDAGHLPQVEQPNAFVRVIREFLQEDSSVTT